MVYAAYPGLCDTQIERWLLFLPQKYLFTEFRLYKSLQAHSALASSLGNTAVVLINSWKFSVPNSSDQLIFVKRRALDGRTDGLKSRF